MQTTSNYRTMTTFRNRAAAGILWCLFNLLSVQSWSPQTPEMKHQHPQFSSIVVTAKSPYISTKQTRRDVFNHLSNLLLVSSCMARPKLAQAAAAATASTNVPTTTELARLPLGHARVRYLLDHWDEITSVCGTTVMSDIERIQVIRTEGGAGQVNGSSCTKTPLRVQDFMGYKSTNDPLYRIDKLLIRAGPLVDSADFGEYLDAIEQYRSTADATALLAYTSSWGEANPYVEQCFFVN
jgi:hypothetical protein